jgi:hypothetical protein
MGIYISDGSSTPFDTTNIQRIPQKQARERSPFLLLEQASGEQTHALRPLALWSRSSLRDVRDWFLATSDESASEAHCNSETDGAIGTDSHHRVHWNVGCVRSVSQIVARRGVVRVDDAVKPRPSAQQSGDGSRLAVLAMPSG